MGDKPGVWRRILLWLIREAVEEVAEERDRRRELLREPARNARPPLPRR